MGGREEGGRNKEFSLEDLTVSKGCWFILKPLVGYSHLALDWMKEFVEAPVLIMVEAS